MNTFRKVLGNGMLFKRPVHTVRQRLPLRLMQAIGFSALYERIRKHDYPSVFGKRKSCHSTITSQHSSRMRTAHLQTVHASVTNTRCHSGEDVLKWTKFIKVFSDDKLMSLAGGRGRYSGLMSRGKPYLTFSGVGVPYHVTYLTMHLISILPPPPCGQIDAC